MVNMDVIMIYKKYLFHKWVSISSIYYVCYYSFFSNNLASTNTTELLNYLDLGWLS